MEHVIAWLLYAMVGASILKWVVIGWFHCSVLILEMIPESKWHKELRRKMDEAPPGKYELIDDYIKDKKCKGPVLFRIPEKEIDLHPHPEWD
jgi:hypothetical protein